MLSELQSTATLGLAGQSALELFCGVGFFTIPLSRNFEQVEVVEGNPFAVADLEENLRVNRVENCRIAGSDLSAALRAGVGEQASSIYCSFDPPRSGLPKTTVQAIAHLSCPNFVYVSCDPATLARDLRILLSSGYELRLWICSTCSRKHTTWKPLLGCASHSWGKGCEIGASTLATG
jgi:23S rRNA (uracil1939-C5)-methyltransferase